jgi:undecaprenyl-diphosphatase
MLELNSYIFNFLHSFSYIPFVGYLADFPIFFLPLFLVGIWLYYTFWKGEDDKRIELLHIFYACALALAFSYIIKQFVDIERPERYLEETANLIMHNIPEKSFPSDHATVSLAFAISLLFMNFTRTWYIFLGFAIIMNICRVIVGVHWPLDIIAGMVTGILWAYIFFMYLEKVKLVKKLDTLIIKVIKIIRLY